MSASPVVWCGACHSTNLRTVLDLGSSPPTCVMQPVDERRLSEEHYPLELLRCEECTLVQLSVIVDPDVVFPLDYPYSSGNSRALHEDFEDLARQADSHFGGLVADDLVVDIGANDGTLLSKFSCRTIGVEPTGQAGRIEGQVYAEFFTEDLAHLIVMEHGPAKVVTACNVLAHVEDIDDVMSGIRVLLADDGILIAENHDLASVVDGQWDTVYHEHLRYYDPHSFRVLLDSHGLGLESWGPVPTHGGSFRMVASKGRNTTTPGRREYDFDRLALEAHCARAALRKVISQDRMCGIGATARATTIINYCGLDVDDIAYVCEVAGSDKIGRYVPGTRIPIVDESRLVEDQLPAVLFSWHLANGIIPKLRDKGYEGRVFLPLPALQTA